MAKCDNCGKRPMFGHNRSHALNATLRQFKPNIQKVTVLEGSRKVRKMLCAKCIKALSKV